MSFGLSCVESMALVKLYIGGLPPAVDDSTIAELLSAYGQVESVNLSRDSGLKCLGYGFAKMVNEEDTLKAIAALHNKLKLEPELFPGHGPIQLRIVKDEPALNDKPMKLFIGGVPGTATGKMIRSLFQPYGEILDMFISPEKGYAFVKYSSSSDATAAMNGINGMKLPNGVRPLEVRIAQSTKGLEEDEQQQGIEETRENGPRTVGIWTRYFTPEGKAYYHNTDTNETTWDMPDVFRVGPPSPPAPPGRVPTPSGAEKGPSGSNIFVYGLPDNWLEKDFCQEFSKFGKIISTKIIFDKVSGVSKGYGFISYASPSSADSAVASMHGVTMSNGKKLKVQIKRGEDQAGTRPY